MRPLTLTMQAFGSYGKAETIDFGELGEHRLFLIHGPTGAGKTTVLDAICFALYGDATGVDRDAKGFRSDFASPTEITSVTFEFAVGERTFRIVRQPEQLRAKLRGEGMTKSPVAATMWERTDAADDDEGTVLASKWSEVTAKVEELLGFRSEQFRQVIVLPQGRFRDLLMASSSAREEILQQLFDTSFYKKIQVSLKDRARELAAEMERQRTRRSVLLDQSDCDEETELAELIAGLKRDLTGQEEAAESAQRAHKAALKSVNEAAGIEKRFVLQDDVAALISGFEKEAPGIETARNRLEQALQANSLSDFFTTVTQARQKEQNSKTELESAKSESQECEKKLKKARDQLKIEKDKEKERKRLTQEITELERIRPAIVDIAVKRAARDQLRADFENSDRSLKDLLSKQEELATEIDELRSAAKQAQAGLRDRVLLERNLTDAKIRREHVVALAEKRKALEAEGRALEQAKARTEQAEKHYKAQNTQLLKLIDQRHAGSAALLAKDLKSGEECPVCGSTEHPQLAQSVEDIPNSDAIEEARQLVDEANATVDEETRQANEVTSAHSVLKGEVDALVKTVGDGAETKEQLDAAVAAAESSLNEHGKLAARIKNQDVRLDELNGQRDQIASDIEQERNSHADLTRRLSEVAGSLAQKEKDVGRSFESEGDVDIVLDAARQSLEQSREALENATASERDASSASTEAAANLQHAKSTFTEAADALTGKTEDWLARLEKAGFATEKSFVESALSEESRNELRTRIEQHEKQFNEAKVRARDLAAELKDLKRPNVSALQEAAEAIEEQKTATDAAVAAIGAKIKTLEGIQADLGRLGKELESLDERYGVLGTLASTADGQNSLRISLQRFVLATRLDDVLSAASQRLSIMTKGRYRIQRNKTADDKRAAGGLELEVEDAYTGSCRPVSTLSGGESFQAALSLALGLSEVVQAYAGGIRLDTIFVDEGFGSLDQEALELAIRTLIDLQATGRLVGIISHVPELKEEIDVRLQIKSGKAGSTAQFQLP